ncbi:hypothetical protein CEQ21_24360 [Niallia circulans]|uniref:Uncharacterized protein n=1 Tax=Niallia circulans TaxID=1397 RepID=A0A553SNG8_NIACI|nr:hypothetical protein [Niallia circulans]TRZ38522.1 hypothetical protein CEQ21_24360 [Niallia circulans]
MKMTLTTTAHNKTKNFFKNLVKEGQYVIGNVTYKIPLFKIDQDGDQITFYLYLDDSIAGAITKWQLVDVDGEVFDDQPDSVDKKSINGVLVAFRYTLKKL